MVDVQITVREHYKEEVFDEYKALKMPSVNEELFAITVIKLEAQARYIAAKDPLEQVFRGDNIYGDVEIHEMVQFLAVSHIVTARE